MSVTDNWVKGIGSLSEIAKALESVAKAINNLKQEQPQNVKLQLATKILKMQDEIFQQQEKSSSSYGLRESKNLLKTYQDIFNSL